MLVHYLVSIYTPPKTKAFAQYVKDLTELLEAYETGARYFNLYVINNRINEVIEYMIEYRGYRAFYIYRCLPQEVRFQFRERIIAMRQK